MEEKRREYAEHNIVMNGRTKLSVTGIEDVDNFDDDCVVTYTSEGVMTVRGADLRINRLNVESGELEIEGEIDSIEYSDGHKGDKSGFFSKLFK